MSINQQSRQKSIAVVGVGKLGLCLALNLERAGYKVIGIDVSQGYCDRINDKTLLSPEPEVNEMLWKAKNFYATTQLSVITDISSHPLLQDEPDLTQPDSPRPHTVPSVQREDGSMKVTNVFEEPEVLFIAVATPTLPGQAAYDHSQLDAVFAQLSQLPKPRYPKQVFIVCTTMPGYTEQVGARFPEMAGRYSISYTPQFIAQGSIVRNQRYPDQLLVGQADPESGDVYVGIMNRMVEGHPKVCRMRPLSAEIAKLATNCFLTTKIAYANAIGDLATLAGAEADLILECVGADSRINPFCLRYGYGYGGPCFPRDNRALASFSDSLHYDLKISHATDASNAQHLDFQFETLNKGLHVSVVPKKYHGGYVFDSVAYKPGSVIIEESQQLLLAVKLARAGHQVLVRDRAEVVEAVKNQFGDLFQYEVNIRSDKQ